MEERPLVFWGMIFFFYYYLYISIFRHNENMFSADTWDSTLVALPHVGIPTT
jgi:hypothetical protein